MVGIPPHRRGHRLGMVAGPPPHRASVTSAPEAESDRARYRIERVLRAQMLALVAETTGMSTVSGSLLVLVNRCLLGVMVGIRPRFSAGLRLFSWTILPPFSQPVIDARSGADWLLGVLCTACRSQYSRVPAGASRRPPKSGHRI